MASQTFDILFSGQIIEGEDPEQVKGNIARIFKTDTAALQQLFSGTPVRVKSGVDQDTAIKYRLLFRDAGALIDIKPTAPQSTQSTTPAQQSVEPESEKTEDGITLLPANTGSLIDCAPTIEPTPIPDISNLTMASPGTIMDETPLPPAPVINTDNLILGEANAGVLDDSTPAPPADINTDDITMADAKTGTLEDCVKPVVPAPLPDISQIKLDDD